MKPVTPAFDGYRLGVGRGHAAGDRRVINLDDGWEVSFCGVANRQSRVRSAGSNASRILFQPDGKC